MWVMAGRDKQTKKKKVSFIAVGGLTINIQANYWQGKICT